MPKAQWFRHPGLSPTVGCGIRRSKLQLSGERRSCVEMRKIRLPKGLWWFDPNRQLGKEGGFGAVYAGKSADGEQIAVKRLNLSAEQAAHRELAIASELLQNDFVNVLQVLDAGYDTDSDRYYVVMPRAEESLQDYIEKRTEFPFPDETVVQILRQIVGGLLEVPSVVHRDLKPDNILFHSQLWKIADFGIARFVEESTSANTLRECLSPQYAAPEQWALQRASTATDLYAVGCIAYALLTGSPPYRGSSREEYREQHLFESPPNLSFGPPKLRLLISGLLRKPQDSRPSLARVVQTLDALLSGPPQRIGQSFELLQSVGIDLEQKAAAEETEQRAQAEEEFRRRSVAQVARTLFLNNVQVLFDRIRDAVPSAVCRKNGPQEILTVDNASLKFTIPFDPDQVFFKQSMWDVLHSAHVELWQRSPEYCWSSSFWYTNLGCEDGYRWYEVSYFESALLKEMKQLYAPFYLRSFDADQVAAPGLGRYQIAFGPEPIDDEHLDTFMNRWAELLAKATLGELRYPSRLPLT